MNTINIVILTWNGLSHTKKCLDSLMAIPLPEGVEITVVDNGSSDGTPEYIRSLEGNIRLIENKTNEGYARAVNQGIRASGKNVDVILLNNDVEILQERWVERLAATAYSADDIGLVGVKILQQNGRLQHCGAYMPLQTYWGQQIAGGEHDINQYHGVYDVESVVFACVYIKRSTIEKVGVLCEDFFAYFEDSDYCLRAKLADLRVVMDGRIRVLHAENSSTKANGVSFNDIFLKSQKTFKKKWSQYLEANRYTQDVDWHSIINFPSGYAGTSRSLVENLDHQDVRVAYRYVYGPGTPFPVVEPEHSTSYIVNCVRLREFDRAQVQVVYAQGDVFSKNTGKKKVGYTMLEVDGLPAEWVRQANLMDEVWVPSTFNAKTFAESGVKSPIQVVPLGIDPAYFSPQITGYKNNEKYVFLSVFEWGERKCPELLLKAFTDEFSANEDVILLAKINNFDGALDVRSEIGKLGLRSNGGKVVVMMNEILSSYELGALYRSADCFVLPTRGEGWGMPILEAMACGLPVIATDWSAQQDFMTADNAYPLAIDGLVPAAAKCPYYQGFRWAQPSYEHLRERMRYVYEHREAAAEQGARAAIDAAKNWSWQRAGQIIRDRLAYLTAMGKS